MLVRRRAWVQEALVVFLQALHPNPIVRTHFILMRSAFISAHRLPDDFDFVEAARSQLDYDMARVVGLSVEMWAVWCLLVLLSGLQSERAAVLRMLCPALPGCAVSNHDTSFLQAGLLLPSALPRG